MRISVVAKHCLNGAAEAMELDHTPFVLRLQFICKQWILYYNRSFSHMSFSPMNIPRKWKTTALSAIPFNRRTQNPSQKKVTWLSMTRKWNEDRFNLLWTMFSLVIGQSEIWTHIPVNNWCHRLCHAPWMIGRDSKIILEIETVLVKYDQKYDAKQSSCYLSMIWHIHPQISLTWESTLVLSTSLLIERRESVSKRFFPNWLRKS